MINKTLFFGNLIKIINNTSVRVAQFVLYDDKILLQAGVWADVTHPFKFHGESLIFDGDTYIKQAPPLIEGSYECISNSDAALWF